VDTVGAPKAELFWWTEDTEYLQWRIPEAGFHVVWTDDAVMNISRRREDGTKPAWKYYYEARNQVFHRVHVQRDHERPHRRHLRVRVRLWRSAKSVAKLAVRALRKEHTDRLSKFRMVLRGAWDGLLGRLGRTVPVADGHRPVIDAGPPSLPGIGE
jgi:GT2 family glycosyltransferase